MRKTTYYLLSLFLLMLGIFFYANERENDSCGGSTLS